MTPRTVRLHFLVLFLLGLQAPDILFSQTRLRAVEYNMENGLSHSRVNECFIDRKGFLWVGTHDGLNRYDGYDFEIFRHRPLDSTSISDNYINTICEDAEGHLWIGTRQGLNIFHPWTGEFSVPFLNDRDNYHINASLIDIHKGDEGAMWLLTPHHVLKIRGGDIQQGIIKIEVAVDIPGESPAVSNLVSDHEGNLLFATSRNLFRIDPSHKPVVLFGDDSSDHQLFSGSNINDVFCDRSGIIWIAVDGDLYSSLTGDKAFHRYSLHSKSDPGEKFEISDIGEDSEGNLWITGSGGIMKLDRAKSFTGQDVEILVENKLRYTDELKSILCDNSDIIWSAGSGGLYKIDLKPDKFRLYNQAEYSYPRLSSGDLTAIKKEGSHYLWLGYWNSGIDRIDLGSGRTDHFTIKNGLRDNRIRSFFKDTEGRLWVGTSKGIDLYDSHKNKFNRLEDVYNLVPGNILTGREILSCMEDSFGNIWIGTNSGLMRINRGTSTISSFHKLYNENTTMEPGRIYAIAADRDNYIWVGTGKGLLVYNPEKDIFEAITPGIDFNWLLKSPVYSIITASDGRIWIGTSFGLSVYDKGKDVFMHYSEEDGLENSFVYAILEDKQGNIWVSTNRGLSRFNPEKRVFRNYSLSDGLQAFEFNWGARFKADDGEIFFGGVEGLNTFYPDSIPDNSFVPEIAITDAATIDASGMKSLRTGNGSNLVRVKYNQSFVISFSALDFTFPEQNQYKYSLQELGRTERWIPLGYENSVTISNLPSGEYEFRVTGSNNDGIWNPEGTSLRILVEAPFWKTRMATISYIMLSVLGFYFLFQYRTLSLRKSNRILKDRELAANEISRQKELLSIRNKNIEDSLKYAQRIQEAMLTTPGLFKKHLPASFILHKPKEIVSGDFYWISELENYIFVAAVDCTGHGVPGAFMSVIGFELFRKIINFQGIRDPGKILDNLNQNFQEIFASGNSDISLRDGMDLAFCVINKKEMVLNYAGAFNPLYLIRDDRLTEIKGDRLSVGADNDPLNLFHRQNFNSHRIKLRESDMIYMFTDGYTDQFGGPEGKKYKYRRFRHLLLTIHKLPLERQKHYLDENIEEWRGKNEQVDDILVIGIRPEFK